MNGFVTIVRWLSAISQKETCRTMEKKIRETSIHNDHFNNLGEPLNKFVYFDTSLCEYNVIFLYPNGEDGVIDQFADYLNYFDDDDFPSDLITSKYGPVTEYDVKFKPIDINTDLLTCLRTCQYLGYMKYMNREKFDTINISTKNLKVADNASILLPFHAIIDRAREKKLQNKNVNKNWKYLIIIL